jgi:hypothetical protein
MQCHITYAADETVLNNATDKDPAMSLQASYLQYNSFVIIWEVLAP